MHWSDVWEGDDPYARIARTALTPLSWLYGACWQAYLLTYSLGFKRAQEPHRPVVCVGNLVAGGVGKTPVTLYVADEIRRLGRSVVIGCSGYGSPRSEGAVVAPEGDLDSGVWGDEAAMIRWLRPTVPLIVGRARVTAARLCKAAFPEAVFLMDDGFQHLPVKKHVTLLLDPPRRNRRCLPAGPYREPWRNRTHASLVLPNGMRPTFRLDRVEGATSSVAGELLDAGEAAVLCALGEPRRFVADLQALGFQVPNAILLSDHDPLLKGNLLDPLDPDLPVVITAKDWVKLRKRPDIQRYRIFIARQEARIEPEGEFRAWLERELDELTKKRPPG